MPIGVSLLLIHAASSSAADGADLLRFEQLQHSAACLVRKDRHATNQLVATDPDSAEEQALVTKHNKLITRCQKKGTFNTRLLLGAAAQYLWRERSYSTLAPALTTDQQKFVAQRFLEVGDGRPPNNIAIDCLIRSQTSLASSFVSTEFASETEARVRRELVSFLPNCIPVGSKFTMQPFDFRLAMARRVYGRLEIND